jgi:hypothetical protein
MLPSLLFKSLDLIEAESYHERKHSGIRLADGTLRLFTLPAGKGSHRHMQLIRHLIQRVEAVLLAA